MSERTLCRSRLMGNDAIGHALAFYKSLDRCNLHGNVDVITIPAGTACTLDRCYLEDVNIETPTPHLIKTVDCQLDRSGIRQSFVAPQGAHLLRRFADDIARVQLIGGGSIKTVTFEGPGAEARALEYQAWANEKLAATVCPTKEEAERAWERVANVRVRKEALHDPVLDQAFGVKAQPDEEPLRLREVYRRMTSLESTMDKLLAELSHRDERQAT